MRGSRVKVVVLLTLVLLVGLVPLVLFRWLEEMSMERGAGLSESVELWKWRAPSGGERSIKALSSSMRWFAARQEDVENQCGKWSLNEDQLDKVQLGNSLSSFEVQGHRLELRSSGSDFWDMTDSGSFVFFQREFREEDSLFFMAKVKFNAGTKPDHFWAKSGLMVRARAEEPNSQHFAVVVTPYRKVITQWRDEKGGFCDHLAPKEPGQWLMVYLEAGMATALSSDDGNEWFVLQTKRLFFAEQGFHVGFMASSHQPSAFVSVTFTNVRLCVASQKAKLLV